MALTKQKEDKAEAERDKACGTSGRYIDILKIPLARDRLNKIDLEKSTP